VIKKIPSRENNKDPDRIFKSLIYIPFSMLIILTVIFNVLESVGFIKIIR